VGSDGSFSVSLPSSQYKKISCSFLDSSGALVGDIVYQDTSKKSLSGGASTDNSVSLASSAALGSLTLDTDGGEAVVDKSTLGSAAVSASVSAANAFDFTGAWTIGEVPTAEMSAADKAAKFSNTLCADHENSDCSGPPKGQEIYLKRIVGKDTSGNDAYGMMVWQSAGSFEACGSKLGNSYESLKTETGVDFSSSGVAEGNYGYASSVNVTLADGTSSTATLSEGWKLSTAKAMWTMMDCGPVAVGSENGWQCTDTAGKKQINLGGGCKVTSTGKAVQPKDSEWSNINTCNSAGPDANGFYTSTCTGTIASGAVSCTNKFKQDSDFNWNNVATIISSGQLCSSIAESSNKLKLAKLQCYANAYWSQRPSGGCMKKIQTDFSAEDPENFISDSERPENLIFANLFQYNPDGLSGGMFSRDISYRGVRLNSNGQDTWVNCKVKEVGALSFSKVSDSKLKANYISTTTLAEAAGVKPACDANFGNSKVEKFVFYLSK
jgi:hypothetical protein